MKAALFDATGGPDVLRVADLPDPTPGPGEVRVRVAAASVNPIDTYVRAGLAPVPGPLPFVTGKDFAGTVDAVGPGVTRYRAGDRVWGANQGFGGRPGAFAEVTVAGEGWVYPVPAGVGFDDAAAAALTGITAHLGLFHRAGLRAGETVFVNGGTGGVGAMVVQLAKTAGATVITTAGTDEKVAMAKSLGADVAVNYRTGDVAAAVTGATGGAGVNVWYETQPPADLDRTVALTAPRGRVVVMAGRQARPAFPNGPFYVKGLSLVGFAMFAFGADELRAAADGVNAGLAAGTVRPVVGRVFPLAEAAAAHRLQEEKSGAVTGKIVVRPTEARP